MQTPSESSLLLTLQEISQLVAHSRDSAETLSNIVKLIQKRCATDVCSVYLYEPERKELVLAATVGLKQEGVGRIRMRLHEGLVGLAAERLSMVTVEDAEKHERYKFFPEAGEERYHSFMGLPLVERGALQGVLVTQTVEPREFSTDERRMFTAVAAQIAPLVTEANLLDLITDQQQRADARSCPEQSAWINGQLKGRPMSPGQAAGRAFIIHEVLPSEAPESGKSSTPKLQLERLALAMESARSEILRQSEQLSILLGEHQAAIMQAQFMIAQDRKIERDLQAKVEQGQTAESALSETLHEYLARFSKLSSEFFRQRAYDIKDVFRRFFWHLEAQRAELPEADGPLVLVASELSIMDLFSVDLDFLSGVVVESVGDQSHAAILVRSLGLPMIGRIPNVTMNCQNGEWLSVDGTRGIVSRREGDAQTQSNVHDAAAPIPPDVSGLPSVLANINLPSELSELAGAQLQGIGLYRSEFLLIARRSFPTEEEQVEHYRRINARIPGGFVNIRTFDLRPEKIPVTLDVSSELEELLDWRKVLESQPMQRIFKDQVRAILRTGGGARILIPMVSSTEQLDFVVQTIRLAREELSREGLAHKPDVPLGIMVEVSSAVRMIPDWSQHVQFIAIGTNDLFSSSMGLDRETGTAGSDPLQPGVLRLLHDAIHAAHSAGCPVSVCGEMAADPLGSIVLTALGVDSLSVPIRMVGKVRAELSSREVGSFEQLRLRILAASHVAEVYEIVKSTAPERETDLGLTRG